jgi:predicted alpha/beta-hydrolase family hydrolase
MPWLVAGKKIASPANQLDQVWIEVLQNLEQRYGDYKKIFIGRSTGARVICRTAHHFNPDLIVNLAFPLKAPNGKSRKEELVSALEKGFETVVIQGRKDSFGSFKDVKNELGSRPNLEVIDAGELNHKLSNAMGELLIECLKEKGLVERQGSVGL